MNTRKQTTLIRDTAGLRRIVAAFALPLFAASMLVIAGCEDESPAEEAADEVEEAAEETADVAEDVAEETADEAEEATDELEEELD